MEVNETHEVREKVVGWINSKEKDFNQGLDILKETGYKPHVTENFEKNKNRKDIPAKIEHELRLYLRYYANPKNEIHADEQSDVETGRAPSNITETDESKKELPAEPITTEIDPVLGNIQNKLQDGQYPPIIKTLLTEFSDLYKQRSILHTGLKQVGEDNGAESAKARKSYLLVIDALSQRMDMLYAAQLAYEKDGTLPGDELFKVPFDPHKEPEKVEEKKVELTLATDMEGLKKQSDNWRTKIVKAENRLNFQSERKGTKPNPIPAGPKRIIQEKKIIQLKAEKELIEYAIADLK